MSGGAATLLPFLRADENSPIGLLIELLKSSGIYAIAALTTPLVTLVLTPVLAHYLSPAEYGKLTLLNAGIALATGVTQLGLATAFVRAYNYDYTSSRDRRDVLATVTLLLALTSIPVVIVVAVVAPFIAKSILGASSLGTLVLVSAIVVLTYNLTIPGFSWLRGENRPFMYSLLAVVQSAVILAFTLLLLEVFRLGVTAALIAMVVGYASVVVVTIPMILFRCGIKLRREVATSLIAFGLPIAFSGVATWVLQLSDRYLVGLLRSLGETGIYAVGYTLGSALAVVIVTPFQLAWPTTMYAIAKRQDAVDVFRLVFRWFGICLVFSAVALSLVGKVFLDWLFPASYRSAGPIIPVVAAAWVFYGAYAVLMTGANLKRKTWLMAVYTTIAALLNLAVNFVLIPSLGGVGAAASTLVAYAALAAMAYVGNQRVYPIPFEIGRFLLVVLVGAGASMATLTLANQWGIERALPIDFVALAVCGLTLVVLGTAGRGRSNTHGSRTAVEGRVSPQGLRVCMHVLGPARTDVRVMREATALARVGVAVSILDIEHDSTRPTVEEVKGVQLRHVMMSRRYVPHYDPTRVIHWLVFKVVRIIRGSWHVLRTSADVYHAHDVTALPPCYVAAVLRGKPLIYDAHELPLVDPHIVARPVLRAVSTAALQVMMPRCTGVVTVSSGIANELHRRYGGVIPLVVRNVPEYHKTEPSDKLRHLLGLGPQQRIILYQGGLQVNRGLELAVLATPYLVKDAIVVLMGRGEDQPRLEALIASTAVGERVKILPPVPYDELLEWTASATVGLLINSPAFSPNVRMGLPNKLFEYLMAGLPVFASELEAVAKVVRDYDVGHVVDSMEPEHIGRALSAMLSSDERLAQMRRNALNAAREHLRWDIESSRLVHLYERVAELG